MSDYLQNNSATKAGTILGVVVIGCIVLIAYFPMLGTGLWADDYVWLERAGRSELGKYLTQSFDLRSQGSSDHRRPLFGILMWVEYSLFRADGVSYHAVSILIHLLNALLVFGIVDRISGEKRLGLIAGLLFALFPLNSFAVSWV